MATASAGQDREPSDAPRRRRSWGWHAFWLLLGLALVVRTGVRDRGVITDHIEFGRRLLAGADVYAPYLEPKPLHPPYPPSFGLLTAPFSLMPERVARVSWGVLQVGALFLVLAWLRAQLVRHSPALRARADGVLLLSVLLGARFILRDTHGGGGNLINLALVTLAFWSSERGRERLGGVWFGISLATKPTAVLVWPLLLAFGYRRAAKYALLTLFACVLASLALARFDPEGWVRWVRGTWAYATQGDVFAAPALGFPPFTWMNQCLRCAVARFAGDVPAAFAAQVPHFVPGLGFSSAVVVLLRTVLSLLLLGLTVQAVARARHAERALLPALAGVLALSLLLAPISWKAHHVALLPCFALLFARALAPSRAAWIGVGTYAAACVLGEEITGKAVKEVLQSSYVVTVGTLALWTAARRWTLAAAAAPSP